MVCLVAQSCPTLTPWSATHHAPPSTWDSPGKNTDMGFNGLLQRIFLTQGLNPGLQPMSPTLQANLLSDPSKKPKNTGVGSLSHLQRNFPT